MKVSPIARQEGRAAHGSELRRQCDPCPKERSEREGARRSSTGPLSPHRVRAATTRPWEPQSCLFGLAVLALVVGSGTLSGARADAPRLVVLVVVDQFPRAYLDRFDPLLGDKGLRRLLNQGADYRRAYHEHFITATAAGHAVMLTGAYPNRTGIINNWWYSRLEGHNAGSVEDARFGLVGPPRLPHLLSAAGSSPLALKSTTVGDVVRVETGMLAQVLSASLKDRAAVLLGGRQPSGAYWFDPSTCAFVSSSYYVAALPEWVQRFNAGNPCAQYIGGEWRRLRDAAEYVHFAGEDDLPYEVDAYGLGRVFPHPIREWVEPEVEGPGVYRNRYASVAGTPFGDELLLRFAEVGCKELGLGRDAAPDILALSFSSNDYIGHSYGPHSQETMDSVLRIDQLMARLIRFLDDHVGKGRWTMVFTSDHGVAPVPERLEQTGVLPTRTDHYRFDIDAARVRVEMSLKELVGAGKRRPEAVPDFIAAWDASTHPFIYIRRESGGRFEPQLSDDKLLSLIADQIASLDGVARVYRRNELSALSASHDPLDGRAYRTWHADTGGDLLVGLEPYWMPAGKPAATNHGSPYTYDRHVPLVLYGNSIRRGRFHRKVAMVDLASTLAQILRVPVPPLNEGRPLSEALE